MKFPWIKVVAISCILLIPVVFWGGGDNCYKSDDTSKQECSHYDTLSFAIIQIAKPFDAHKGFFVGLATIFVAFFTWCLWESTNRLWEIANKELITTHRPKLRIRNIDIHTYKIASILPNGKRLVEPPSWPLFAQGHHVGGQLYISNIGDSQANIIEILCWVDWRLGELPMMRPYEGENSNYPGFSQVLEAGQSIPLHFQSRNIMGKEGKLIRNGQKGWNIHVMGWVEYMDSIKIRRRTAFCRRYTPHNGRFSGIGDADYEHEE